MSTRPGAKLSKQHRAKISKSTRGVKHWRSTITEQDVMVIFSNQRATALALVQKFAWNHDVAISEAQVYSIWSGRTWSHVTGMKRRGGR